MSSIIFLAVLAAGFVVFGVLEYSAHRRHLARIPIRIHVNGTRGKSSVARLLTAALNEAGIKTFGKTTGTLPRMIFPDGKEYPVYRPAGHANVLEQLRIVAIASRHEAQAIVVECMALQPALQFLSEDKLVRATHGVITNAREDHLDVMGPAEKDVALALAGMVPRGQLLFTTDQRHLDVFRKACDDRKAKLVAVDQDEVAAVTQADKVGFPYHEHADNIALVFAICRSLNIERSTALRGMWRVAPDAGALTRFELEFFGRRLTFVNGFAANDPESTESVWRLSLNMCPDVDKRIAVFNCRLDRPQRSAQLAAAYSRWPQADAVLLMGSGTFIFAREAERHHCDGGTFVFMEGADVSTVFETLVGLSGRSAVITGMANIAGPGLELVHYFENRSILEESVG